MHIITFLFLRFAWLYFLLSLSLLVAECWALMPLGSWCHLRVPSSGADPPINLSIIRITAVPTSLRLCLSPLASPSSAAKNMGERVHAMNSATQQSCINLQWHFFWFCILVPNFRGRETCISPILHQCGFHNNVSHTFWTTAPFISGGCPSLWISINSLSQTHIHTLQMGVCMLFV